VILRPYGKKESTARTTSINFENQNAVERVCWAKHLLDELQKLMNGR